VIIGQLPEGQIGWGIEKLGRVIRSRRSAKIARTTKPAPAPNCHPATSAMRLERDLLACWLLAIGLEAENRMSAEIGDGFMHSKSGAPPLFKPPAPLRGLVSDVIAQMRRA
jgi:hypothetical protein